MKKSYFHFYDENTFNSYRIPVTCTLDEWSNWTEDNFGDYIARLETTYGVHDSSDWELDDVNLYGFSSYELETQESINELLIEWKRKLVGLGWVDSKEEFFIVNGQM